MVEGRTDRAIPALSVASSPGPASVDDQVSRAVAPGPSINPPRHPNEDAWAADPIRGAFAVCDGVTATFLPDGSYPSWAGGGRAAWLAAAALVSVPTGPARERLTAALATADRLIDSLNTARDDGPIDYWLHDVYNTTAVAAVVENGRVTVACLGDAAAFLRPADAPPLRLTRCQTEAAERLRDEVLRGSMAERERVVLFRRELRNRVAPWQGRADVGFGVLDGTGRYADLVEWVERPLGPGDRLYLCSDAVAAFMSDLVAAGESLPMTAAEVIERARRWETDRRTHYHDDLTVLMVEG